MPDPANTSASSGFPRKPAGKTSRIKPPADIAKLIDDAILAVERDNGRDSGGRFTAGNKLAKGNPIARTTHRMRQAISKAATPAQAVALLNSLNEAANDKENTVRERIATARLGLRYTVGPPRDGE